MARRQPLCPERRAGAARRKAGAGKEEVSGLQRLLAAAHQGIVAWGMSQFNSQVLSLFAPRIRGILSDQKEPGRSRAEFPRKKALERYRTLWPPSKMGSYGFPAFQSELLVLAQRNSLVELGTRQLRKKSLHHSRLRGVGPAALDALVASCHDAQVVSRAWAADSDSLQISPPLATLKQGCHRTPLPLPSLSDPFRRHKLPKQSVLGWLCGER